MIRHIFLFLLFALSVSTVAYAEGLATKTLDSEAKTQIESFMKSYASVLGSGDTEKMSQYFSDFVEKIYGKSFIANQAQFAGPSSEDLKKFEISDVKATNDRIYLKWKAGSKSDSQWHILRAGGVHGFEIVDITDNVNLPDSHEH